MNRLLITGVAGFIGSRLAARLLAEGWTVTGIDVLDPVLPRAHRERALAPLRGHAGFRLLEGDVRDPAVLHDGMRGVTAVAHLAARAGVRRSVREPAAVARINVGAMASVLAACRRRGVRRIVYASSSSVYGAGPVPFREETGWLRPASPYAASKRAGELLAAVSASCGARVMMLRCFSVYGPGQRADQALWQFARRLAAGQAVDQYGDGSTLRDFTYVDDVVDALCRALEWTAEGPPAARIVNVGGGTSVRVDAVIALVAAALGRSALVRACPPAPGDVPATRADVVRARRELGWIAQTPLTDGVAAFADWFEVTHGR